MVNVSSETGEDEEVEELEGGMDDASTSPKSFLKVDVASEAIFMFAGSNLTLGV